MLATHGMLCELVHHAEVSTAYLRLCSRHVFATPLAIAARGGEEEEGEAAVANQGHAQAHRGLTERGLPEASTGSACLPSHAVGLGVG